MKQNATVTENSVLLWHFISIYILFVYKFDDNNNDSNVEYNDLKNGNNPVVLEWFREIYSDNRFKTSVLRKRKKLEVAKMFYLINLVLKFGHEMGK
eukprot:Pgem_evm1s900